jgi:hypothetical protein
MNNQNGKIHFHFLLWPSIIISIILTLLLNSDAVIKYSNQPAFLGHYLLQNHYPEVPASLPA